MDGKIIPPWASYTDPMACRLVYLNKCPGVRPVGIQKNQRRDIDKLNLRAEGDQAKVSCGKLQLCSGIEAGI